MTRRWAFSLRETWRFSRLHRLSSVDERRFRRLPSVPGAGFPGLPVQDVPRRRYLPNPRLATTSIEVPLLAITLQRSLIGTSPSTWRRVIERPRNCWGDSGPGWRGSATFACHDMPSASCWAGDERAGFPSAGRPRGATKVSPPFSFRFASGGLGTLKGRPVTIRDRLRARRIL